MNYLGIHNYNPDLPSADYESLGSYRGVDSRVSKSSNPQFLFDKGFFTGNYFDGLEYVRRFLQQVRSMNFYSILTIQEFWDLQFIERISDGLHFSLQKTLNNTQNKISPEDFLVWKKSEQWFLGIVTKVNNDKIFIATQGTKLEKWQEEFSDEFRIDSENWNVFVEDGECLGWLRVTDEEVPVGFLAERKNFNANVLDGMFNLDDPFELAFSKDPFCFGEYRPVQSYFEMSKYFFSKLQTASSELHHMLVLATKRVIDSDELLRKFEINEVFWPLIRKSWHMGHPFLSSRFDLVFNNKQMKMLEYNADSAGMIAETAIIQNLWAQTTGCAVGEDPGIILHSRLIKAWQQLAQNKQVHIFIDYSEDEELYMEKYYARVLKEAGIRFKEYNIVSEMRIIDGKVVDKDGDVVEIAWKLWNWNTICNDYLKERVNDQVRLSDVMFNEHVQVFEPFWKIVTSNKAILAVVWEMFPEHPYLLKSFFELEGHFDNETYVSKPISGRLGQNVTILKSDNVIEGKEGNFKGSANIYQEFFDIPSFDTYHIILGAWVVGESGTSIIIREHQSLITGYYSPMITCRLVNR